MVPSRYRVGLLGAPPQEPAELIRPEAGVAKDAGERSFANLLVERDDERVAAIRLLEANVAAALAGDAPAVSLQRPDQVGAGDDRLPRGHAGSGNLRRMTPNSSESPSSRKPST